MDEDRASGLSIEDFEAVSAVVRANADIRSGMGALIAHCAHRKPWSGWEAMLSYDVEDDYLRIRNEFCAALQSEPPTSKIAAFMFGLFQMSNEDAGEYRLYFCGSDRFTAEDENCAWAVDPVYWPTHRQLESKVIQKLSRRLGEQGGTEGQLGEYVLLLGYAALVVLTLASESTPVPVPLPRPLSKYGLAAGFDSGDCIIVSRG